MIIAVDFDGILCEDGSFPEIGKPIYPMISFIRELMDKGHEVILWPSRVGDPLQEAVKWCEDRGLHFCAVNDNAPSNKKQFLSQHPDGARKVYADVYIDDHNAHFQWKMHKSSHGFTVLDTIDKIEEVIEWKTSKEAN